MPLPSTTILPLILTLSSLVLAQDFPAGYTGCYTIDPSNPLTGLNPAEFNLPRDHRNQCIATCFQSEILAPHAFFWYTIDPNNSELAIPNCRCSYPAPPVDTWKHGDAVGDCIVNASYLTRPSHRFTGCYDLIDSHSPTSFPVAGPEECLSICPTIRSNLKYSVIDIDSDKQWGCRCITDESYILPFPQTVLVNCDIGSYFIYRYDPGASPSQVVRKRRRQQKILQMEEQGSLCPEGLEACPISRGGVLGDYECIDTTLELESCGGCVFGENPKGVDCTSLPGVLPGSVLCSQGKCQVTGCEKGYDLVEGACKLQKPRD